MSKELYSGKNALIICLSGEIDQHSATELKQKIDIEVEQSAKKNLIMDLKDVELMDSSGIGLILGRYKITMSLGGTTVLCNVNENVRKMINLSGIGKIIKIYNSIQEAEKALSIQKERKEV